MLQEIADSWPEYLAAKTVNKQSRVSQLVREAWPAEIGRLLGPQSHFYIEGSDGRGNITAAPWLGVFDPRISTSATTGYYVVYLYSVDLSSITLCIAFGTTQFEEQFGGPTQAFPRMREAASRLQDIFGRAVPARYSRKPINLMASRTNKLHFAYEQSAIISLPPYVIGALPTDEQMQADLIETVGIYSTIVSDPLKPEIELLLQSAVPVAKNIQGIEVRKFSFRSEAKARSNNEADRATRRYSPQSRKVGDAGEHVVLVHEREKLLKQGLGELAPKIRHHAVNGEFPGWDITSFDEDGQEIYIEVKASLGATISSVDLTANEWRAATQAENRSRYFIYIVTDALSERPKIEKLRDPYGYVLAGDLLIEPYVFQLSLRAQERTE
jgi:hypothetical protein